MDRNREDELPPHAAPDERSPQPNETDDSETKKAPAQPKSEPGPAERPDLDWAEHED